MHIFFKRNYFFIFCAIFSLLLFSGCGGTSSTTELPAGDGSTGDNLNHGRIQGTIIASSTGNVIAGAIVETFQSQAVTGADGRYLLGPVPAGDYRLVARASGYAPIVKDGVRVYPGKITENQNFTLSTEAASFDPEFAILAVLPALGTDGDVVSIFCRGCGSKPGQVTFNGKNAQIIDWNSQLDDKIRVQVPAEVETGPVKVIIEGQSSKEIQPQIFTARPFVLSAQPSIAQGGQIITLYGRNFNLISQFNKVKVADLQCTTISVANSSTMQIQLPQIAKTGLLSIRIESNEYQLDGFSDVVITIRPELVHLSPKRSVPGVPLTLYGYNFGENKSIVKVLFGGHIIQPNDFLSFSDTSLSFEVPDNSILAPDQSAEVVVQVNESQSNSLTYTAYNTINNTLTEYGIYDFKDVSQAETLRLASLKPTERIVFISVYSGDGTLDLDGDYSYNISAYLGGNFTQVPNLPASVREIAVFPHDMSARQSGQRKKPAAAVRAALTEPATTTLELYMRNFASADPWDPENDLIATGTIQATTSLALVYYDIETTGMDIEDAQLITGRFDDIYKTLATACWDGVSDPPEGNIDEQERIALFVSPKLDVTSSAEQIAAYFDVRDKNASATNSAGTEIIYLNSEVYKDNENDFYGGLTQALSFMFYHNQKSLEGTTWQDYGLSTFARQAAGYGFLQGDTRALNWVSQYMQYSEEVSLNHWPDAPNYYDYGMGYLFTQYIFDRCGGYNAIRILEKMNGARGLIDIENNILRAGMANPPAASIKEFFHDFCLALFCDDLGLSDSFPGYDKDAHQFKNIQLRGKFPGINGLKGIAFNENPVTNSSMVIKGYGCRMIDYPKGNWGDLEVSINSTPILGDFRTWVIYYSTE
ncbi:MAG: hypothetical protein PWR01_3667 [Clostridiales bacterium]|nr:hypothetical protein [Clostridiales bacterium]MDN5282594.1 hypothetical protein [Candidatus Ozemobacter sp.]